MVQNRLPQDTDIAAMTPLKITVAPNGARRTKADHPQLPMTSLEIAETARDCFEAGAHEIHLHVRDEDGEHSLDAGRYRDAMTAIAEAAPQMSVQVTTEAAGRFDVDAQYAALCELAPEAASVSVREMARDLKRAAMVYEFAREANISVQHILYDQADQVLLNRWYASGIVPKIQNEVLLVLGKYAPAVDGEVSHLATRLDDLSSMDVTWSVCTFGGQEHAVAVQAMQMGGHVRVGFENNFLRPDGTPASHNAENIRRTAESARSLGRLLHGEGPVR